MIEFTSFTSKTTERAVAFADIRLDGEWCMRHLSVKAFILATVTVAIQIVESASDGAKLRMTGSVRDEAGETVLYGQILDALLDSPLKYDLRFGRLAEIWMKYHMNDLSPNDGTETELLYEAYEQGSLTVRDMLSPDRRREYIAIAVPEREAPVPVRGRLAIPEETIEFLKNQPIRKGRLD